MLTYDYCALKPLTFKLITMICHLQILTSYFYSNQEEAHTFVFAYQHTYYIV